MIVDGSSSFILCMFEVFFVQLANPKEAPNTYAMKNGVANISFEIDAKAVAGYYVDVFNPKKKRIFQCYGSSPENVPEDFKGKIKLFGDYNFETISFSLLNATEEDAGHYRAVIEMKGEEVGKQLLVVFAQFETPKIWTTKGFNNRGESDQMLTCQVDTNGTPPGQPIPVSYKWKRNGHPVEHNDKYEFQNSTLIIKYFLRSDLTDYFTCWAENEYGAKSPESMKLDVSQNPMRDKENCVISCIHGACSEAGGELKCNCNRGWTGFNCSTEIDECSSTPCHRGSCYNHQYGEYLCICSPGWTGKQCELDIDECAGRPCVNGGYCQDLANDYLCHCTPGWTGKTCQIGINECQSSPCRHGTCEDLTSSYICNCDAEWTGTNCETAIDACSFRPCSNGRCELKLNSSDDYDCVCSEGWSGKKCDIDDSQKSYIFGAIGAGCAVFAIFVFILGICYRKYKTRMYMDAKMNSEDVYHDVKRIQSGDYWSIDDEQIYDIRGRIKSEILVETNKNDPSDDYPYLLQSGKCTVVTNNTNPADDYPYLLQSEKCPETLKDGIQTAADGFLNPAYSNELTAVLETTNAPGKSQNSSIVENTNQNDNCN